MGPRQVQVPKGYKIKKDGKVSSDDRMYASHGRGIWIEPSFKMVGKNVSMFLMVATPQVII